MHVKLKCLFTFLCCSAICTAQQVVSSSGYTAKSEISVNWILGGNISAMPHSASESAASVPESSLSLRVYPTPAIDFFNVEITPADSGRFILDLFNDSGIKIISREITGQFLIHVDISDLPCGIYYLRVTSARADQSFSVEKIVKTQTNPL